MFVLSRNSKVAITVASWMEKTMTDHQVWGYPDGWNDDQFSTHLCLGHAPYFLWILNPCKSDESNKVGHESSSTGCKYGTLCNYYLSSLFVHLYGASSSSQQQLYDFWLILLVILATDSTVCFVLSFSYAGFPGFQADYIHWKSIGQMCGPGFSIDTIVVAWHPWLVIGNSNALLC